VYRKSPPPLIVVKNVPTTAKMPRGTKTVATQSCTSRSQVASVCARVGAVEVTVLMEEAFLLSRLFRTTLGRPGRQVVLPEVPRRSIVRRPP
jgi:hypothetical protein